MRSSCKVRCAKCHFSLLPPPPARFASSPCSCQASHFGPAFPAAALSVALDILRRTAGSTRPHLSGQSPPNPPLLLFVLQPLAMALSTASAIDAHLREATADPYRNVPRAIFLAARSNDPLSYSRQAGWARLPETEVSREQLEKEGTPIKQDDIAEMYSCTKLCGSIAALQLLEEGKIALEDDASKFVKELKDVKIYKGFDKDGELILEENSTPITVRSLITHTAGCVVPFVAHVRTLKPLSPASSTTSATPTARRLPTSWALRRRLTGSTRRATRFTRCRCSSTFLPLTSKTLAH